MNEYVSVVDSHTARVGSPKGGMGQLSEGRACDYSVVAQVEIRAGEMSICLPRYPTRAGRGRLGRGCGLMAGEGAVAGELAEKGKRRLQSGRMT